VQVLSVEGTGYKPFFEDPILVKLWTFRTKIVALFPQQPCSPARKQVGSLLWHIVWPNSSMFTWKMIIILRVW